MTSPVIRVDFNQMLQAANNLKARSADFVRHMGDADQMCKPLKQSWVESGSTAAAEYQTSWIQIVNGAVRLSDTIDALSKAIAEAKEKQERQERDLANKFPSGGGR